MRIGSEGEQSDSFGIGIEVSLEVLTSQTLAAMHTFHERNKLYPWMHIVEFCFEWSRISRKCSVTKVWGCCVPHGLPAGAFLSDVPVALDYWDYVNKACLLLKRFSL